MRFSLLLVAFLILSLSLSVSGLPPNQVSADVGNVKACRASSSSDPSTTGCMSDAECQALYGSNSYCDGGSCVLVDTFCPEGYTLDSHTGECVPTGDTHCPPGYTYDPYTGQCYPQEQWFQYQTTTKKYDTVKAYAIIRSDSGQESKGIGSFRIWMDEIEAGSITSGQTLSGKLYAGTCYQTYLGSTTGYTQYQGEQCENVKRQHKVELSLPVGAPGDKACPTGEGRCFLDPRTNDIRYYLVSDPVQYKGDGETAEFLFKLEYSWSFATVDQKGNPIDLTRSGFGFYKSDRTGPFALGSETLKEGTTFEVGLPGAVAEVSPRNTRYVYDHTDLWVSPDLVLKSGPVVRIVMDGIPRRTVMVWQKQYYLTVNGECLTSSGVPFTCGNPQGEGYHDEGATATFSADSRVRDFGWMGSFGGFYQFDQWRGDSTSRTSTNTITMDSPKQITAIYTYNDTIAIRNIAIAVSLGTVPAGVLIWVRTRPGRGGRRPPPPPPRFPPPPGAVPPGGWPPGAVPPGGWPPGAVPPGGWPPGAGPPPGGPGFQPGPRPPPPPGLGPTPTAGGPGAPPPGATGPGAGGPGTGGPGAGGPGTGGPGAGGPGTGGPGAGGPGTGGPGAGGPGTGGPGAGGPGTGGPGAGGPGTGGPGTGGRPPTGPGTGGAGAGEPGTGAGIEVTAQPAGSGVPGAAVAAAGVGAAGIGAVALARRRGNKCVWCGSKMKRDQIVCPRCGVHQECATCGTALYKASIVSKGYSANPEDQGLFCDNCNTFRS